MNIILVFAFSILSEKEKRLIFALSYKTSKLLTAIDDTLSTVNAKGIIKTKSSSTVVLSSEQWSSVSTITCAYGKNIAVLLPLTV